MHRVGVLSSHCDVQQPQGWSVPTAAARKMCINGQLVDAEGGKTAPVINPATGEVFDHVPAASQNDLNRAVAAAKEAYKTWSQAPFEVRAKHLKAFGDELMARKDEFSKALTMEQGKPLGFATGEIMGSAGQCHRLAKEGQLPKEVVSENKRGVAEIHYMPRGVVGGITPWNFPVSMAANKLFPAVITGNTVVLKPSPYTPLATCMLSEIAAKTMPPGVMNILTGSDQLGQWMVEHPDIKHISFTGSAATGKKISATAAATMKKLTLELGGNDAAIVLPGTDVKAAAPKVFGGAMFNSGQVCVAIKRLYVHESQYEPMVEALAKQANSAKIGDGLAAGTTHGPINNKMQLNRVSELVEDARSRGARIVAGGKKAAPTGKPGAYFYEPTIIADVGEEARVVKEEQFGPALPVLKYKTVDEAVQRANATEWGLGGSVWGPDAGEAAKVGARLETGTVWINNHLNSMGLDAPFGGVKSSGVGKEGGGKIGLKEFVDAKSVFVPKSK